MAIGIMKVKLVGAKGLKRTDFLGRIDPYVVLQYKNQEWKSSIAKGQGRNPIWNEKFKYRVDYPADDEQCKVVLKIMDHDTFTADDYLGEAKIYVKELIELGVEKGKAKLRPQKYRVVDTNLTYQGEIQVGITFTTKKETFDKEEVEKSLRRYLDDEERPTKRIKFSFGKKNREEDFGKSVWTMENEPPEEPKERTTKRIKFSFGKKNEEEDFGKSVWTMENEPPKEPNFVAARRMRKRKYMNRLELGI